MGGVLLRECERLSVDLAKGEVGELRSLCALTDGNLSRHLDVLHEARLIEVWKGVEHRRPQTLVRLSTDGRRRFIIVLAEQVLRTRLGTPQVMTAQLEHLQQVMRLPNVSVGIIPAMDGS